MPVVKVTLIEGYDAPTIQALSRRMTDAVRATIAAVPDGITIIAEEVSATRYMRGGQTRIPGPPAPSASETVKTYLAAMEARDLPAARACLDDDFEMVFPGDARMSDLDALVKWSAARFTSLTKTFIGMDETFSEDRVSVYCRGTLSGTWLDGSPFEGIRFMDRLELRAGKIIRQDVWNDMAEFKGAVA